MHYASARQSSTKCHGISREGDAPDCRRAHRGRIQMAVRTASSHCTLMFRWHSLTEAPVFDQAIACARACWSGAMDRGYGSLHDAGNKTSSQMDQDRRTPMRSPKFAEVASTPCSSGTTRATSRRDQWAGVAPARLAPKISPYLVRVVAAVHDADIRTSPSCRASQFAIQRRITIARRSRWTSDIGLRLYKKEEASWIRCLAAAGSPQSIYRQGPSAFVHGT